MGRPKRSDTAVHKAPVVERERPRGTATIVGAFCPCCGKTIQDRAVKVGNISVGRVPYFDSIEWDPNKPFGVRFSATGRGSLKDRESIGPEDAPELFEGLKRRLIAATKEWEAKGWLTAEDLR